MNVSTCNHNNAIINVLSKVEKEVVQPIENYIFTHSLKKATIIAHD